MYLGVVNTGYATSFFISTILRQLGWTAIRAQVLSIPIYVFAASVTVVVGFISDRIRHRFAFTILGVGIGTIGYALLLAQKHVAVSVQYCALYLITAGGYCTQPLTLIWLNNNLGGHYKKGIGAAIQIAAGNLGGIVASNIFITDQAPTFPVGYWVSMALLWETAVACTIFWIGLKLENNKRGRGHRDERYDLPCSELENLGDDHPRFRYVY